MSVKIKLIRIGRKKQPLYKFCVQDQGDVGEGKVIEILGFYNPLAEPNICEVKADKVKDWLAKGAQPTEKVRILLGKAGVLPVVNFEGKVKRKPKKEQKEEAAKASEAAPAAENKPA